MCVVTPANKYLCIGYPGYAVSHCNSVSYFSSRVAEAYPSIGFLGKGDGFGSGSLPSLVPRLESSATETGLS